MRTYLATAPELYLPDIAVLVAAAFWRSVWLAVIGVVALGAGAWLFRGVSVRASEGAPLAIVAPADGRVTHLDCLRPLGYGRIVVRAEDGIGRSRVGRVAPMDGVLTTLERSANRAVYQLDTDVGRWTLTFGGAAGRIVPIAADGPIRRGDTIAVVKWAGGEAETEVEYPLRNVKIMPSVVLGATVRLGDPIAEIQAVWA